MSRCVFEWLRAAALSAPLALAGCEQAAQDGPAPEVVSPPAPAADSSAGLPPIPALEGVSAQGAFDVDGAGRFVPSKAAVELFEYYLTLADDQPVPVVRAHIEAAIRQELADPAPALDLLDRYLPYRESLEAADLAEAGLPERLARVRALRVRHFGPELAADLFAAQEARAEFEIEWQRIAEDPALSEDEREERLETLEQQLPAPIRLRRKLARVALRVEREEAQLRAEGRSEEEIRARREERFGRTASERVEQLRTSRAAWEERLSRWRQARDPLLAELADSGEAERLRALAELRAEHFGPRERPRVEALDALETGIGEPSSVRPDRRTRP